MSVVNLERCVKVGHSNKMSAINRKCCAWQFLLVCVCVCVCVRACVRVCVRACVRACMRACVHVRACVHMCMGGCVCAHVFVRMCVHVHACIVCTAQGMHFLVVNQLWSLQPTPCNASVQILHTSVEYHLLLHPDAGQPGHNCTTHLNHTA